MQAQMRSLLWYRSGCDGEKGQLVHIDRNPGNIAETNAAFLCVKHHDHCDGRSKQAKGFTVAELRFWQRELVKHMKKPLPWPDATRSCGDDFPGHDAKTNA